VLDAGRRGSGSSSASPQINFQGSKEIANTMAGKLNEQAPIRVTVLESDADANGVIAKVVSDSFKD
jgi:hypothetical protein